MDSELKSKSILCNGLAWRVVEHQYTVSTPKLTNGQLGDSDILEGIIEESKYRYPEGAEPLHYLLKTPFRYYPPRPHGSRFRTAQTKPGVYYGSLAIRTALAEMAYYRYRFFKAATTASLPKQSQKLTVFSIKYQCAACINLTLPPFSSNPAWTHRSDYTATQNFAVMARKVDICAILYESVRDIEKGINIALLTFSAFACQEPLTMQTWYMDIYRERVSAYRSHGNPTDRYEFLCSNFVDD